MTSNIHFIFTWYTEYYGRIIIILTKSSRFRRRNTDRTFGMRGHKNIDHLNIDLEYCQLEVAEKDISLYICVARN